MAALQAQVAALSSKVASLTTQVSGLQASLAAANSTIAADNASIASLEAQTCAAPSQCVAPPALSIPPAAGTLTLTISGGNNRKIRLDNGVKLFINDTRDSWSSYQNLPAGLIGTVGNDTVNNVAPVGFTLSGTGTATCYLIRQDGWSAVDMTGWTPVLGGDTYFTGYGTGAAYPGAAIFSRTFGPGSYSLSTLSALYGCVAL